MQHLQRDGEFEITGEGVMVHRLYRSGHKFPVIAAFEACAEMFDIARARDAGCPDSAPLHRLIRGLEAGEISNVDLDAAASCLAALRAYTVSQPIDVMADVAKTVEIKFRMEALNE